MLSDGVVASEVLIHELLTHNDVMVIMEAFVLTKTRPRNSGICMTLKYCGSAVSVRATY